jgi:hypothetical protein
MARHIAQAARDGGFTRHVSDPSSISSVMGSINRVTGIVLVLIGGMTNPYMMLSSTI